METKSLLVGAGLVVVGFILGFGTSTMSVSASNARMYGPKYGREFKNESPNYRYGNCEFQGGRRYANSQRRYNTTFFEMFQDSLSAQLELTPEQQLKVDAVFVEHAQNREQRQYASKEGRDMRRKANRDERDKMHAAILEILDETQTKKFESMVANYCRR